MDKIKLALEMNKIVHDECKDIPHDIGLRLLEIVKRNVNKQLPPTESELKQIFLNHFDCYTEGATDDGWKSEPAMTVDRFIEVVKSITVGNFH